MDGAEQPEYMRVADTIVAQLGGQRFVAMTGAHTFLGFPKGSTGGTDETATGPGVSFKLRRGANRGINYVRVWLRGDDTYDIGFYRIPSRSGRSPKTLHSYQGIYADQLQQVFTAVTGLYTTL